MTRKSRRLDPSLKLARAQLRGYVQIAGGARPTVETRVALVRGFIKMTTVGLLNEFQDQAATLVGIDVALENASLNSLEQLAVNIAELRNRLRVGTVLGKTIH